MFWSRQSIFVRSVSALDRMKLFFRRFLPSRRRFIQLYSFLLYNAHLKGFLKGDIFTGVSKGACVPGLNCYSCPGAVGACPLGALQNALAASNHRAPFYAVGILLLYGLIFGRTVCGFLCPFGLFQDLLHKIPQKQNPPCAFKGQIYLSGGFCNRASRIFCIQNRSASGILQVYLPCGNAGGRGGTAGTS